VVDDAPRTRFGLIFAVVVVAGTLGMWGYLFLVADPNVPDQLDDEAFVEDGEAICEVAREQLDQLPPAREAEDPRERSVTVEDANEVLDEMVLSLRDIAPTEGSDARVVELWLDDWTSYLEDRATYAAELAEGEEAELLVTPRSEDEGGGQITETIDHFANINNMEDCAIPGDV
jgi:hypothetical protein